MNTLSMYAVSWITAKKWSPSAECVIHRPFLRDATNHKVLQANAKRVGALTFNNRIMSCFHLHLAFKVTGINMKKEGGEVGLLARGEFSIQCLNLFATARS